MSDELRSLPTTTPTTPRALALYNLREALAYSTAFQQWLGTTGEPSHEEEARLKLHVDALPQPATGLHDRDTLSTIDRPCAIIYDVGYRHELTAMPSPGGYNRVGVLSVTFFDNTPAQYANNPMEIWFYFAEAIDLVVHQLTEQASAPDGRFMFQRAVYPDRMHRGTREEEYAQGDYLFQEVQFEHGPGL